AAAPPPDDHTTSARWILERNPFDSVTPRPLDAVDAGVDAAAAPEIVDLAHYQLAPVCEGLKAVMVIASPLDPAWSMAAIAAGAPGTVPADIASKIQRISATEFNVDKQVVDKVLENQAELMRSARIVPEQENGKVIGIRLFGVRPDTLLGTLGLENGDRVQSINGFDMASPEKALEAYARLRTADHLTVQVNRRGQNTNIDFNIK